mmetsp:Transcript_40990/g.65930  ORF Transcript_40990/g.65930 Transcript_40990/m.65930 type:complete len:233 (-) Transcript_40990:1807-2505(-)
MCSKNVARSCQSFLSFRNVIKIGRICPLVLSLPKNRQRRVISHNNVRRTTAGCSTILLTKSCTIPCNSSISPSKLTLVASTFLVVDFAASLFITPPARISSSRDSSRKYALVSAKRGNDSANFNRAVNDGSNLNRLSAGNRYSGKKRRSDAGICRMLERTLDRTPKAVHRTLDAVSLNEPTTNGTTRWRRVSSSLKRENRCSKRSAITFVVGKRTKRIVEHIIEMIRIVPFS